MSDQKKTDLETVQREYGQLCAKAGHISYQIWALTKDLEVLNTELRDLNFKAASIAQAPAEVTEEKASE